MRRQRLPKPGVHMVTFRLFLITALFFLVPSLRPASFVLESVQDLSMGGTGIASADPTYAAWYNPARLGFAQKGFFVSVDGTALQERTQFRRSSVGLLKPPRDQDNPSFYENKIFQNTEFSDEFLQAKTASGRSGLRIRQKKTGALPARHPADSIHRSGVWIGQRLEFGFQCVRSPWHVSRLG